jgi:diguanylate cyclase (GGDEF)-like protein
MSDFIAEQADFILFFYGLAFILLGITCFAIARSASDGVAWPWLGSFGLVHGVSEWLDLSALVIGDTPNFVALRLAVMAASYLMLLEFARRNLRRHGCWLPGAWVHAPLVACVIGTAMVGGISVANALARYGIGFVGALGTGVAFALLARQLPGRGRRLAFLAAVGWVLYGVAAGLIVPAAPFWPASGLNQRWFLDTTGLPIQLIRGLIACAIAIAIWGIWGQQRISTVSSVRYTGFVHRQFIVTAAAMFAILLSGWGLTEYLGVIHKDQLREEAQGELDLLAASLSGETAPADGVVRLYAGAPTVRAFMSSAGERSTSVVLPVKDILALAIASSGARRGYVFDKSGALVLSVESQQGYAKPVNAKHAIALAGSLIGRVAHHFDFDAERRATDYFVGYPIDGLDGEAAGTAVLEKPLALRAKILAFNTAYFLTNPGNEVALTNRPEWLEAVQKLPVGRTTLDAPNSGAWATVNGSPVYVAKRLLDESGWKLLVVSPVEGIFASRVLGIALTLLASIMLLVYVIARERAVHDHVQMDRRLELEELARDLDFKATTDPLTGLSNRLKFDQALSAEIRRARRFDVALSLVIYDVDHFKQINDAHGHQVGDDVLIKLSGFVAKRMRETDLLARWGGEEFVILLPLSDASMAEHFAEILCGAIATLPFDHGKAVTCSFGVAQLAVGESAERLVARADEALYRAKLDGRNRVETASMPARQEGIISAARTAIR